MAFLGGSLANDREEEALLLLKAMAREEGETKKCMGKSNLQSSQFQLELLEVT